MKHYYLSIFLAILLSMVCTMTSAHDIAVANSDGKTIYYNYNSDGSSVTVTYQGEFYGSYSDEYIGEIAIPESVNYSGNTYSVTSIASAAFEECRSLTSVTIPNSVTSIGYSAFQDCSGMAEIKVANGNSVYDSRNDCNAIIETSTNTLIVGCKNTIIPESVTSIGGNAFVGCSGLTSVTIPNSVTSIGPGAFSGCSGLTSVTIPNSVASIGNVTFSRCSGLTSVTIPNSVTSIGDLAFYGCSGLTSVTIPNSVTSIGSYAFYLCSGLTSVTIPNSVASIGVCAFQSCSGLTSVTIPNSVTSIGERAFYGCSGLTSVTIPNSVTSIASAAFYNCSSLTSVTIPNSVTSIGASAFYGCSGLTSVVIPNSVTTIDDCAFSFCSGLTSVTIPNSVTSIGSAAFYNCSSLTSVTIPNSMTSIGDAVFEGCSGLTSVTIPSSVTSIGLNAFSGCSDLKKVIVPDIKNWCCIKFNSSKDNPLYYAQHLYSDENTEITKLVIPDGLTGIADYTFYGCNGLTSVNIPNSVESIGALAFGRCSGLTSLTIPNSVTSISKSAFSNCNGLTSVIVGNNIENISDYAFYGCGGLTSVTIPNSVNSIGSYAFSGCSGLTSVTIGNSVTSISYDVFSGCTALTKIKIRAAVPPICEWSAFEGIDKETCTLYVSAESIGDYQAADQWKDFFHIEELNAQGDSNGDDEINEVDYSGVASYIMGEAPGEFDAEACDVDVNGTVDVRDYVGIANIISTGSIYGGTSNNAKAAMSKGMAMPATDDSDADNVIYVENVSGSKNSQVELSVRMKNASDIRGFQFDLYLPEGVTMANNAKASLSSDRLAAGDAHTLMVNEVSDGAVRFLCSSMNDESFAGGDGEIATLTVNIADDVANGDYDVVVKNALMTETDISKSYEADDIKSTLTVLDQTGVETVTADNERRDGSIYTVGGQLVGKKATTSQLRKGVYIRNGKKYVVK